MNKITQHFKEINAFISKEYMSKIVFNDTKKYYDIMNELLSNIEILSKFFLPNNKVDIISKGSNISNIIIKKHLELFKNKYIHDNIEKYIKLNDINDIDFSLFILGNQNEKNFNEQLKFFKEAISRAVLSISNSIINSEYINILNQENLVFKKKIIDFLKENNLETINISFINEIPDNSINYYDAFLYLNKNEKIKISDDFFNGENEIYEFTNEEPIYVKNKKIKFNKTKKLKYDLGDIINNNINLSCNNTVRYSNNTYYNMFDLIRSKLLCCLKVECIDINTKEKINLVFKYNMELIDISIPRFLDFNLELYMNSCSRNFFYDNYYDSNFKKNITCLNIFGQINDLEYIILKLNVHDLKTEKKCNKLIVVYLCLLITFKINLRQIMNILKLFLHGIEYLEKVSDFEKIEVLKILNIINKFELFRYLTNNKKIPSYIISFFNFNNVKILNYDINKENLNFIYESIENIINLI